MNLNGMSKHLRLLMVLVCGLLGCIPVSAYTTPAAIGTGASVSAANRQMTPVSSPTKEAAAVYGSSATLQGSGSAYASPVYTPFSGETPSSNAPARVRGRRNMNEVGDTQEVNQSTESPIGAPWILLAFAGAYGIARRKRSEE